MGAGGSTYFWLGASSDEKADDDRVRCEHSWWDYRDEYRQTEWRLCAKCGAVEGQPT